MRILLVEDNPGDVRLMREALAQSQTGCELMVAQDGVEAISYLRAEQTLVQAPRPDLILLDLNLPRMSGLELLAEIKSDEMLRRIPVIILSSSQRDEDVYRSYDLHANCYVVKPTDLEHFWLAARAIESFWLKVARLPRE